MSKGRRIAIAIGVPIVVGVLGGVVSGTLRNYDQDVLATLVLVVAIVCAARLARLFWQRYA